VHAEADVAAEYRPAAQFWHVVACAALANLPTAQFEHSVAAATLENWPAEQSTHILGPPAKYFPEEHAVHVPPSGPVYPALHEQLANAVHAVQAELAGHAVHVAAAAPAYWPAVQVLHVAIDVAPPAILHEPSTPGLVRPDEY
jgi:hypothetical protein